VSPSATGPGPRDLAHFEQFRHYHETFYAQVEALSVTPYSADVAGARPRRRADQRRTGPAGQPGAGRAVARSATPGRIEEPRDSAVEAVFSALKSRRAAAQRRTKTPPTGPGSDLLVNRLDRWVDRAASALADLRKTLVYERTGHRRHPYSTR
jgi:hypothetical protein